MGYRVTYVAISAAATACSVVVSKTGTGQSAAEISSMISVQPRMMPCAPRSTRCVDDAPVRLARLVLDDAEHQFVVNHAVDDGALVRVRR